MKITEVTQFFLCIAFFTFSFSKLSQAKNSCDIYLDRSGNLKTKVVEALRYNSNGQEEAFTSPIPTNYQYPDELKIKFETLMGSNIFSPTALSILNSFPHQETDFKYITLESWNRFIRNQSRRSSLPEHSDQNNSDRLLQNSNSGIKPISIEEIFSPMDEPHFVEDIYQASQAEIDKYKLVKIPYWFLIFYSAAKQISETEFPESESNSKIKIQRKKSFQKTLGTFLFFFNKMTRWLNSQGLISKTFNKEHLSEINQLPFRQEVKDTLKKLIQSGILFRFSHSDPAIDIIDLTDSWMDNTESLAIGCFKSYDAFTDEKVLVISTAGPQLVNLWMNRSKKNDADIKNETILDIEDLILHEALHAFSFSEKRVDLIGKYIQQKFGSTATEESFIAFETQMLKSRPELSRAEFRSSVAVSVLNLIATEAGSGGEIDFIIYKLKSLIRTIYSLPDLNIDDDSLRNLVLSFRDKTINSDNFVLIIQFTNQIENQLNRMNIVHARILAFYIYEISRTLEEYLAHKVNKNFLDPKPYGFYQWAVNISRDELAKNWSVFFALPIEFNPYLD